jgi:hypothetical protein
LSNSSKPNINFTNFTSSALPLGRAFFYSCSKEAKKQREINIYAMKARMVVREKGNIIFGGAD